MNVNYLEVNKYNQANTENNQYYEFGLNNIILFMVSAWAKLTSGGGTSNTKKNNLVLSISGQTVSESYSALWTCDWLFFYT